MAVPLVRYITLVKDFFGCLLSADKFNGEAVRCSPVPVLFVVFVAFGREIIGFSCQFS